MTIDVAETFPPNRESAQAEFHLKHDGQSGLDVPVVMFREQGQLVMLVYTREGRELWRFTVAEFLEATARGIGLLEDRP